MIIIDSSTLSNQNLTTALLCHTYTAKADRQILIRLFCDQIQGNGNYVAYLTVQKLGAGSAYEAGARTTVAVPSGVTSQLFPTIALSVKETDVVKAYLVGLAGDTTTPDIATEVWDADPLTQFQGTAQAGGASTITLASANSPATDDLVKGAVIRTRGGTGAGQARVILGYVASTKVLTVGRNWAVNPDSTTVYEILGLSVPRVDDNLSAYTNDSSGITTLLARIVGTLLTGNHNPQTGDAYARVGAAGAGLTALGDTRIANLDATVSSRAAAAALTTLQGNVTTMLADYARRTGDYLTSVALPTNFGLLAIDASGRITLAPSQIVVKKNTALANFMFTMIDDTTGDPAAGLTVTAARSIDGAAFGACANAVTGVSGGWYKITLAAADLNGTVIAIRMSATTAKDRDFTIVTQP